MQIRHLRAAAILTLGAAAAACSSGDGATSSIRESTLSVSLMDAPVDGVTSVKVQIAAIWLKAPGSPAVQLPLRNAPRTVDLLGLDDRNAALLIDDEPLAAGAYEWLSMDVNADFDGVFDSYVTTKIGGQEEIRVPSGRVRLVDGFQIGANQAVELLFDWSLRHGLVDPPGQPGFLLKPAFRVLDVTELGVLRGTVALSTIVAAGDANACGADASDLAVGNIVYIFAGAGVTPDDVDGTEPEPIATARVSQNATGEYAYRTVLKSGQYTVAFTCQAGNDDPETNESGTPKALRFVAPVTRALAADATVIADF